MCDPVYHALGDKSKSKRSQMIAFAVTTDFKPNHIKKINKPSSFSLSCG